ncbi:MAG: hypothetical protein COV10_04525 [Candidatus Vogelbacteria bacterium CG10_big_fil_rev_8_21_14_0_10_51_16]|uniref:Ribonuclease VapC n=1 Tax=Candidatus Vogelbacteria bacterium CG10_big_fil_rev_8_21_14_0_10_51_16 TaxID=1975045 RepID=A0A2H0RD72_9BACT|nr:MAG: hypothetical protein COV10_04525 [Candidatus Vogelbacteria bacterium CG10_big_fil_rev_8_21_14_0_10_51_16]
MLLDTNILIALLADERSSFEKVETWKREGHQLCISVINITEILSFSSLNETALNLIKEFLRTFFVFPLDQTTAEHAGTLRRKYGLTLSDACISATALVHNHPLVTRDKGFRKIAELTVIEI